MEATLHPQSSFHYDCIIPDLSYLRFPTVPDLDHTPLTVFAQEVQNLGRIADIKSRYIGERCRLNGDWATISGSHLPFAVVTPDDHCSPSKNFAWTTVEYVMAKRGQHFIT